jgi:hypothetical protein
LYVFLQPFYVVACNTIFVAITDKLCKKILIVGTLKGKELSSTPGKCSQGSRKCSLQQQDSIRRELK